MLHDSSRYCKHSVVLSSLDYPLWNRPMMHVLCNKCSLARSQWAYQLICWILKNKFINIILVKNIKNKIKFFDSIFYEYSVCPKVIYTMYVELKKNMRCKDDFQNQVVFALITWTWNPTIEQFLFRLFSSNNLINLNTHSCMPSTLAPDPIRVQTCVCCLFWTNRDCMAVTSIFLSISLSN